VTVPPARWAAPWRLASVSSSLVTIAPSRALPTVAFLLSLRLAVIVLSGANAFWQSGYYSQILASIRALLHVECTLARPAL
jgi:hypothetical protein